VTMGALGLGPLPLIAILVDETDNAFADVYSTAVSALNLTAKARQVATIIAAGGIGTAVAGYLVVTGEGIGGSYESFLLLIGGLFIPLLGVVIADSFLVRRGVYTGNEFSDAAPRWRWPAFAAWIPGAALYFLLVLTQQPIGATIPSFAVAAGLHFGFSKIEHALRRASSSVAGDP
jgi:nucleobase:cation symporter-1, NCS1 family